MKARAYLALMALAVLVPIILFSAIALSMLMQAEREAALRSLMETARATTLAVDRELSISEARMKVLASAASLAQGDFKTFHARAVVATPQQGMDRAVRRRRPAAAQYAGSLRHQLPRRGHPEYGQEVLRTGVMRVTDLLNGTVANARVLAIDVPVILENKKRYVLSQAFFPAALDLALVPAKCRPTTSSAFSTARVFRLPAASGRMNWWASPCARNCSTVHAARRKAFCSTTPGKYPVYDAYKRSALSGWTVAVGVPVVVIEASARRAVMVASMGLLAAIGCALALAVFFSRRLAQSIDSAANSAAALGRGAAPQPYSSGVLEFDRLHAALEAAGGILQKERESRAAAEQERARLFTSEQEARLLAEHQNRAKDEFLAMLSHELRNPLAAISNSIALMDHPAVSGETAARARTIIKRQSRHLARIVDDLLDLGRLMNGKVVLVRQRLDLAEAVRDCVQGMRTTGAGTASCAGAHRAGLGRSRPDAHRADRLQPGRQCAEIHAGRRQHRGRCEQQRRRAVLTVSDTGIGMPAELLELVFDVFVQGTERWTGPRAGWGSAWRWCGNWSCCMTARSALPARARTWAALSRPAAAFRRRYNSGFPAERLPPCSSPRETVLTRRASRCARPCSTSLPGVRAHGGGGGELGVHDPGGEGCGVGAHYAGRVIRAARVRAGAAPAVAVAVARAATVACRCSCSCVAVDRYRQLPPRSP